MVVKTEGIEPHAPLRGEQRDATEPGDHVWLSASAGAGKTYVLSARVLRLLLRGAAPDSILCLTFTKAGAAEMAQRVHARLAWWVRLDDTKLWKELEALGEDSGPKARDKARTLFAKVLESRGGGLRIMTIHAFCQTLLAGFPIEAGLIPGFRPIEGREETALAHNVLTELVVQAEREGDRRLLDDLSALSRRLGEDVARAFLNKAAKKGAALDGLPEGLTAFVRRAMAIPAEFSPEDIADACRDGAFDRAGLLDVARMHVEWGTPTGEKAADRISEWLLGSPAQRAAELHLLAGVWATDKGTFRVAGPKDPGYAPMVAELDHWCRSLINLSARAALAQDVSSALNAGRRYARAYADAKRVRGLVDFDDLITRTVELLAEPGSGDWIRYKLDQATDHILIDESQDTNLSQWEIIASLAAEFFAGEGARDATQRTMFTVGDFKQAIFGFQGTDPEYYRLARGRFVERAAEAGRAFVQLSLNASFRSSQPVLDVADKVLENIGYDALGLDEASARHRSHSGGFGQVTLFAPLTGDSEAEAGGEESWIEDHVRKLAKALAVQVRKWLAEPMWLHGRNEPLKPGNIMILVRKRGDLAALLVARLQEEGVAVAGVDRLRLKAPLAVKDLLAAMRFAIQRDDDLNLAALLVSPLFGWTQDDLFAVAHGRKGRLWDAIPPGETRTALVTILNAADRMTPFAFLEQILSGPLQGRAKLMARLGAESRDPIDELLSAALQYERDNIVSLQCFVAWFDGGDGEIKRDAMGSGDAVRVMTAHGAKGLEAPLVILADAAGDPDASGGRGFDWLVEDLAQPVPLFRPRGSERALVASLQSAADDADARERREHWRLLYVAMTRAQERLVIAGSLGPRAKGVVPAESWHAAVGSALAGLGGEPVADDLWGSRVDYTGAVSASEPIVPRSAPQPTSVHSALVPTPDWITQDAPPEARPPRPLAPSSLGLDSVANPPASAAMAAAAARGRLLHGLFERLPQLGPDQRRAAGLRWLGTHDDADALVDAVLRVTDDLQFADLFTGDALAEAPIAGIVDGVVISGTVDRLVITDISVTVLDYKTGRRVPQTMAAIPDHHVRQMAAYVAVLAQIFPERMVSAALLYTEGPVLHRLPQALLDTHKPGLGDSQDMLATGS
jgi:ATP-dependent helicase/nuclease subunit A